MLEILNQKSKGLVYIIKEQVFVYIPVHECARWY